MSTRFINLLSFFLLIGIVWFSFYRLVPQSPRNLNAKKEVFSTARAFQHVEQMAKFPHSVGTRSHDLVQNYIMSKLRQLGLDPQIQDGYVLNEYGILSKPQNIIAKIPGTNPDKKALLLLSHYDSAVHSSYGASDAASGVATILEGVRAFLAKGTPHENDIIILFSDAEEIGLLGAKLFVQKHPWAKNVGLVLNFEARGSGGPSNMIIETNGGNSKMVDGFVAAHPEYPVASSLMYSVYKMLPNDTDSTIFRVFGDTPSFFFAFIGDHFDYHTALDVPKNLDKTSLAHQGSYLMSLLAYFGNSNLMDLSAEKDDVYFDFPGVEMLHYPFSWIIPMLIVAWLSFIVLCILGVRQNKLEIKPIFKGFIPFLGSLLIAGGITYFGWQLLLKIYPQYKEILHGFTYNGYTYIIAFVLLTLTIIFFFYNKFHPKGNSKNMLIAPIFIWLIINTLIAIYLKGAAYFIIPVIFSIISFGVLLWKQKPNMLALMILGAPALFLFIPLIQAFPVGLGLKMLVISSVFTVLLFGLLLPVFGYYKQKGDFVFVFMIASIVFFTIAHFNSEFTEAHPKPNSLVYMLNSDTQQATWNTYDHILDDWTREFLTDTPTENQKTLTFDSKYHSDFTYSIEAETKLIPKAQIITRIDTTKGEKTYHLRIIPQRQLNRISLFTTQNIDLSWFRVNSVTAKENYLKRESHRLLTAYVTGSGVLQIDFKVKGNKTPNFILFTASNDLLINKKFSVPERSPNMIPKPFVLNDAILVKQQITF